MNLGVRLSSTNMNLSDGTAVTDLVQAIEGAGAESVWIAEHVILPSDYASDYPYDATGKMPLPPNVELPDPIELLTYIAAVTTTLKLGTGVMVLPEHNPVILAKRLATLDRLSAGRVIAGLGIGWLREEYEALGVPFERRGERADDYLQAMRTLWTQSPSSHEGPFVRFQNIHQHPQPAHPDGVYLLIGGHSQAAARRAGRFAHGMYPLGVANDELVRILGVMRTAARAAGRDADALSLTVTAPRSIEALRELRDIGVHRVVLQVSGPDPEEIGAEVERYATEVLAEVSPATS